MERQFQPQPQPLQPQLPHPQQSLQPQPTIHASGPAPPLPLTPREQQQQQQQGQGQQEGVRRQPLCTESTVVKGQWKVMRQLGMGAFGEIYLAANLATSEKVAIKAELVDEKKQALRAEVIIMRKLQRCPCVGRLIACGRQDNFNYLVMQLLGENLSDMRRRQPLCTFSLPTVCRLAIEMIQALQAIHSCGIVHRDVKPSNFVLDKPFNSPDYSNRNPLCSRSFTHSFPPPTHSHHQTAANFFFTAALLATLNVFL